MTVVVQNSKTFQPENQNNVLKYPKELGSSGSCL